MLVAIGLGHDAGALQTQEQRPEGDDVLGLGRRIVCLRDYARFLMDILEDSPVVLQRLLACVVEHFAHVLCLAVSGATSLHGSTLTTTILNVCHLAARNDVSLRILDNLGRCERRRLRGDCYCVHGADWERGFDRSCVPLHAVGERENPRYSPATTAQVGSESRFRNAQRQKGVVLVLRQWMHVPTALNRCAASGSPAPVPTKALDAGPCSTGIPTDFTTNVFVLNAYSALLACSRYYHSLRSVVQDSELRAMLHNCS